MSELPEFLRQRGITEVRDNIPPGCAVQAPAGVLVTLLRDELTDYLRGHRPPQTTNARSEP